MNGTMHCFGLLGRYCDFAFYSGWGPGDVDELCTGLGDSCNTSGEERDCEVHCDTPNGLIRQGTQSCMNAGEGYQIWASCQTNNACN